MSVMNHHGVRRWHDRFPPRGAWRACGALVAFGLFGVGGGLEHTGRVEVADLALLPDRGAHGSSQAPTTDTDTEGENP